MVIVTHFNAVPAPSKLNGTKVRSARAHFQHCTNDAVINGVAQATLGDEF